MTTLDRMAETKAKNTEAILKLDDEQAERIGAALVIDFCLKRSREHKDRYETMSGTYTKKGIARRAHRIIQEGI